MANKRIAEKKILVVDDEIGVTEAVRHILRKSNYEVIVALDGRRGVEQAKNEKPDLILLDIMMPGMDGFEVFRRLKNQPETTPIPVVMLTARSETGAIFEAQDLRVTDYIIKPFDAEKLLSFVNRYLA